MNKEPREVLFASASKLASVVGEKAMDMKNFLASIDNLILSADNSFNNQQGERVEYKTYEVVKALAYYESFENEKKIASKELYKKAADNVRLPEVSGETTTPVSKLPEIDIDEDEIPF